MFFFLSLGGVREALFSDHNYQLIWKERRGFAKVAIDAKTVNRKIFLSHEQIFFFSGNHSNVYKKLSRSCTCYDIWSS